MNGFVVNDGGRAEAGFKPSGGDCVARSIAIITGKPYIDIYRALAEGGKVRHYVASATRRVLWLKMHCHRKAKVRNFSEWTR